MFFVRKMNICQEGTGGMLRKWWNIRDETGIPDEGHGKSRLILLSSLAGDQPRPSNIKQDVAHILILSNIESFDESLTYTAKWLKCISKLNFQGSSSTARGINMSVHTNKSVLSGLIPVGNRDEQPASIPSSDAQPFPVTYTLWCDDERDQWKLRQYGDRLS
jgi:hypothetical protein